MEEKDFKELSHRVEHLENDNKYLMEVVYELEQKNRKNEETINCLMHEYRYRMESFSEIIKKLNELTLPAIRNMVENDRLKIGEYVYGR